MKNRDDSDIQLVFDASHAVQACNGGLFVSPGYGIHPCRTIDTYELILVRRGVLHIQEAVKNFAVAEGQALLLWPGREHRGIENYSEELSFYWVHFYAKPSRRGPGSVVVGQHTELTEPQRLTTLFHRFLDEQQGVMASREIMNLLVTLILCEVARSSQLVASDLSSGSDLAVGVMNYISVNYQRPISTADIAEVFELSGDHIGRVFRKTHGFGIIEALHRHRLKAARNRLLETNLSIDAIADECGFSDAGYFRRIFRRYEGVSPTQYKRLHVRQHINRW